MGENVWIILAIIFIAASMLFALAVTLRWYVQTKSGVYVHNKVDGILKRYGIIRNFKILRDFEISANGESVKVEHALIGFFGIIFISARGETADFYGEKTSEDWLMIKNEKKTRIENPIAKNDKAIRIARNLLGKNKIYNIPMEGIAVFNGREKKTTIYCADNTIMRCKELYKYLNKAKFDKDNNVDVDTVKELFLNSSNK